MLVPQANTSNFRIPEQPQPLQPTPRFRPNEMALGTRTANVASC